jgi:hypothetical protein
MRIVTALVVVALALWMVAIAAAVSQVQPGPYVWTVSPQEAF